MNAASASPVPEILAFDEPLDPSLDAKAVLGGKGAGLAEMTRALGLPVPPGFTITTAICRRYLATGWPEGLAQQIAAQLERIGGRTGRRFGDPAAPLLVSVRSGAPVSMPGMMDTLLNVGITPELRERLATESGDAGFAADTWLRFCRMYAEIVLGISGADLAAAAACDGSSAGKLAAAERVRTLAARRGPGIPEEPAAQLRGAIEAVFRSWNSDRARVFRAHEGVEEQLCTAVTVQAMVFGNLDDRSGTGVVFTRDPATGDPAPLGDYLLRAQGEDVVAGTHAVSGLDALRRQLPDVYGELLAVLHRLERHYRDLCDVEFTVSAGRLYLLQTRIGRRSPLAAVRIAVAMAEEPDFPLSRAEAVGRINDGLLRQLAGTARINPEAAPLASGLAASPGVGAGVLCCDPDRAAELSAGGVAVILAREQTSPADVHGMVRAAGLVTTTGGVASHAAVVARSWAIPAITSLGGASVGDAGLSVGGVLIETGTLVTVDGGSGELYLGDQRAAGSIEIDEVRTLRRWAAELGVEPGTAVPGTAINEAAQPARQPELTLLDLVRVVQLKGLCTAARAAVVLGADEAAVESLVAANEQLFRATPRGMTLTPDGRFWLTEQLVAERATVAEPALESCYERFMLLNQRFKKLVSEWQLLPAGGQTEVAFAEMVGELAALHGEFSPLVKESSSQLARLQRYTTRFEVALAQLRGGDASMLASPLKDSYHTVWFEYHEELLDLCGRNRAAEERAGGG